ncbi:MAG TPA: hypothetical protein VFC47_01400 [Caulobacteraceae bacterium]|nr:hypothetical protein [Caulobacteraceae bacterium]
MNNISIRHGVMATSLALLLAACATAPKLRLVHSTASMAPIAPTPALKPAQREARAVEFLENGDARAARAELMAVITAQPESRSAQTLLDEIDTDPRLLLGDRSFPHVVKPQETLASLAGLYLGNPRLFYALARYNGVGVPRNSLVGRTILIPRRPRATPVAARVRQAPIRASVAVATVRAPAPAAAVPRDPAEVPRDPAAATHLRAQGLDAMNGGRINLAVNLFRRAQTLDPSNAAIEAELGRARRLQMALQGRP